MIRVEMKVRKKMLPRREWTMKSVLLALIAIIYAPLAQAQTITPAEARAIAKEATIYGFPLVDNYRIQYSYFVDREQPGIQGAAGTRSSTMRASTRPTTRRSRRRTPTRPIPIVGADLRAEPLVLTVPAVEKGRYYSLQFIDMYTFNFAYVGSRATGNDAGSFLLAGPNWKGETPEGIKEVIRSETEFAFVLYRTQLFNPADIDNVKKIQAGYKVAAAVGISWASPRPPPPPADRFHQAADARAGAHVARVLQRS